MNGPFLVVFETLFGFVEQMTVWANSSEEAITCAERMYGYPMKIISADFDFDEWLRVKHL